MIKGVDINQRINFNFKEDKTEPKTVVVLRPLSGSDILQTSSGEGFDSILAILKKSIVEIKNFDSNSIDEAIAVLSTSMINELLDEINKISHLTKDDEKN